jgi:hypothetical protein
MVMTRSMYKMMNTSLTYSHPALADVPYVKWVIVTRNGFDGYATFEDARRDLPYQKYIHGCAMLLRANKQV